MDDNLKRLFGAYDASTKRVNDNGRQIMEKIAAHAKKHMASEICSGDCEKHHDMTR